MGVFFLGPLAVEDVDLRHDAAGRPEMNRFMIGDHSTQGTHTCLTLSKKKKNMGPEVLFGGPGPCLSKGPGPVRQVEVSTNRVEAIWDLDE